MINNLGLVPIVAAHIAVGSPASFTNSAARIGYVLTELDVTFRGGPDGDFNWRLGIDIIIVNWRPQTESIQSFHWSGLQILAGGDTWSFEDFSAQGMDVNAVAYLVPWYTGL